ncbi:hypothetical protein NDU88_006773 [Pleurodeles waltl]|uniref:Uncharacterized protein n=1 Tax=Pleurodeles waltl TaxID=8319 RepID=A0AAV7NU28_PLEWA|nr:hypothetical protein NDU88_006773 [Pleurodeles waltl]
MFGMTGVVTAPKKSPKRDAGHLGDVELSADVPSDSARAHKRMPFREGSLPGMMDEKLHHPIDLEVGSPKDIACDLVGDSSSGEDGKSVRPWHPRATLLDPQDLGDSDIFEPEGIYHPGSSD